MFSTTGVRPACVLEHGGPRLRLTATNSTTEPEALICIRRVRKGLMRLWVVILVGFLAAPLLLWRSAAHSPETRMERVQWLSHAQEKLLEEQ